ncbi:MBL fold metallo-hydrolase [Streptomyces sp. NPDC056519]|uniref:MBL fold metallo-hydrolase n=1 Tax=Streptomyces sp. NPDC056519 TaxID=3345849 RepID=UPI0036883489
MKRRAFITSAAAAGAGGLAITGTSPAQSADRGKGPDRQPLGFTLTWLGVNGWWVSFDNTTFLVDPWVSRYTTGTFSPEGQDPDTKITWDRARIERTFDRPAEGILITHGHFDHISDIPFAATKTGAAIWGTESHLNLVRSLGLRAGHPVDETKLSLLRGGEEKNFPEYTVRVLRSVHRPFGPRQISGTAQSRTTVEPAVERISELGEGGSLIYVITNSRGKQLMILGSADFSVSDLPSSCPDAVIFPTAGASVAPFVKRFGNLIGTPQSIIASHWDNFDLPLQPPTDVGNVAALREAARSVMPRTRVIQPVPHAPIHI